MSVRLGKRALAAPGVSPAQKQMFPAPVRGWILDENLAAIGAGAARILDNWICTEKGVRVRGGARKHATVGDTVQTLFGYQSGGASELFASTPTAVFNVTNPDDADVAPSAEFSGMSGGFWATQQFGTAGGEYLLAFNGVDEGRIYDGASWSTVSISAISSASVSHVWSYANRIFMVEGGKLSAWYLAIDSIGGAATEFSLRGVFRKGGALLFGAAWSLDAGDGLDDKCVFVTTLGEVAVYEGSNPGSAADWRLVGVYQIGKPLGSRSTTQAGGDLLVATDQGIVSIASAIKKDVAALTLDAVTKPIEPYWQNRVRTQSAIPWQMIKWVERNVLIVSQPTATAAGHSALAVNLSTGAWSRLTGWDTQSLAQLGRQAYFGDQAGGIFLMDTGGSDNGAPYTSTCLWHHADLGAPFAQKTAYQGQVVFNDTVTIAPKVFATANYSETLPTVPASVSDYSTDVYDFGTYDVSKYDQGQSSSPYVSLWKSLGVTGYSIAPGVMLTFGVSPTPKAEMVAFNMTYSVGGQVN